MPSRIAFVLILASWVATAGAQNLIANPEFDMNIAGWSCEQAATISTVEPDDRPEVECVWSTDDLDGLMNSGSGQVSLDGFSDTLIRAQIVQCLPVGSSRLYNVGGSLRTLASNGRAGQLDVRWYDDSACQGVELGRDTVGVNLSSSFTRLEDTLVAPVGAASLKFTVISFALNGEEHTVQIDAAFVPEPAPSALLTAALLSIALIAGRRIGPPRHGLSQPATLGPALPRRDP